VGEYLHWFGFAVDIVLDFSWGEYFARRGVFAVVNAFGFNYQVSEFVVVKILGGFKFRIDLFVFINIFHVVLDSDSLKC